MFLIDRRAGQRLANWLARQGHDVRTVWADGQPSDRRVGQAQAGIDAATEVRLMRGEGA